MEKPKVIIVMPTYNEKDNIGLMIDELVGKEFPKIKGASMHLLVVDDNSPDGTGEVVKNKSKKYKSVHLLQGEKAGLGMAYVRGMRYAMDKLNADAVMEMDADFQHPPRFVKDMVAAYLGGADYVIGSRYIKGGSIPKKWAMSRKAMSYFGNLFIRVVWLNFKIHDMTTGFRLTKVKGVLDKIKLENLRELKRFAYKVDLLHQSIKNAKKVVEVPLEFAPRTKDVSKFNIKETISTFKVATILGIHDKERFIKFAFVGLLGFFVNFIFLRIFRSFGLSEVLVWLFATELAIINNYTLNNIWTFKESKIGGLKRTIVKFSQFNLTSIGALVIQSVFGPIGVSIVGVQYDFIVLFLVVTFMVMPFNYFVYNAIIWKTWDIPGISKLHKLFARG